MEIVNIANLIRMGFEPSCYFKRSVWSKITRVMDYLVNKGLIQRTYGEVKYATLSWVPPTDAEIVELARIYMESPLHEHLGEMKKLSKETGLPLNSGELLLAYTDTNI